MTPICSTFSVIVRDPVTGFLGSAVASKYLAVGGAVTHSLPGVGIVHTQSWCSHDIANAILADMAKGTPPQHSLDRSVAADPLRSNRQILVMDMQGRSAFHTGNAVTPEHAQIAFENGVAAGNTLASKNVIHAIVTSLRSTESESLILRLIHALKAAEVFGGDNRGKQSAAVRILQSMDRPWTDDEILDFRVDDHADPVAELYRLHELSRPQN